MVTLAPELDGVVGPGVLIPALVAKGIVVSIGHSEASYEQACAAVKQGASMVTHLFNAIPQMHHRVPGIFGVLGAQDVRRPCFGLISDGVHVHPSFVRVVWGAHPGGLILVTDAMRVLGLADGTYEWTNGEVIVKKGGRVTLGKGDKIAGR